MCSCVENTRARSDEYAEKNGLPKYEYVLHPRTTGFTFIVEQLRKGQEGFRSSLTPALLANVWFCTTTDQLSVLKTIFEKSFFHWLFSAIDFYWLFTDYWLFPYKTTQFLVTTH